MTEKITLDDGYTLPKVEWELRKMLCVAYAQNTVLLYMDDGEAQDNSEDPCIDYVRDSIELIQNKLMLRAQNRIRAIEEGLAEKSLQGK